MPFILMYSSAKEELRIIKNTAEALFDGNSHELRLITYSSMERFFQYIQDWMEETPDIVCIDITQEGAVEALEEIRPKFPDALLLLIADMSISPLQYMKPSIMAASLLLRPMDNSQISEALEMLYHTLNQHNGGASDEECLLIKKRDSIMRVPFSQIYCFESRSKRVFVRTGDGELSIYDTMEGIMAQLPHNQFARCHKGFIVSWLRIRQVDFSQNIIYLDDGLAIPMSRRYKAQIKERLNP